MLGLGGKECEEREAHCEKPSLVTVALLTVCRSTPPDPMAAVLALHSFRSIVRDGTLLIYAPPPAVALFLVTELRTNAPPQFSCSKECLSSRSARLLPQPRHGPLDLWRIWRLCYPTACVLCMQLDSNALTVRTFGDEVPRSSKESSTSCRT